MAELSVAQKQMPIGRQEIVTGNRGSWYSCGMFQDLTKLPVAAELPRLVALSCQCPLVVTAPPGSGKTTLVPAAVLDDLSRLGSECGQVWLVQPRRIAARAVARRIAQLRGTSLRGEVGYQVRFDNATSAATRLTVMTTGIALRRLIEDVALDRVGAVVLDEFHERSVEMDLALGMLWRIRSTIRPDLRIVVMSATLDAAPIVRMLESAEHVHVAGTCFPVELKRLPRPDRRPLPDQIASMMAEALRSTTGDLLVFLPGVGEITRCERTLEAKATAAGCELFPLYGEQSPEQQDRALAPSARRKIILATNIAETSLTVEGVTCVIDSGLARQMRIHSGTGLPRLEMVAISQAAADQRAGRAGRTAPGVCYRLWDQASHRSRPTAETPEILRTDLCQTLLQLAALGEQDLNDFPWLTPPSTTSGNAAIRLLQWLGAVAGEKDQREESGGETLTARESWQTTDESQSPTVTDAATAPALASEPDSMVPDTLPTIPPITPLGQQLAALPVHPRLGRLLLAGAQFGVLEDAALAAALLSERDPFRPREATPRLARAERNHASSSDVVDRVMILQQFRQRGVTSDGDLTCHAGAAKHVLKVADQLVQGCPSFPVASRHDRQEGLMRALLEAFPDRLTKLRANARDRGLMVGGRGVRLDGSSHVRGYELFLSIDVRDAAGDAWVSIASAVQREWLDSQLMRTEEVLFFNPTRRQVEARRRSDWGGLTIDETPASIGDTVASATILAHHASLSLDRVLPDADSTAARFRTRVEWLAGALPELGLPPLDDATIARELTVLCRGLRSFDDVKHADWLVFFQQVVGFDRLPEIDRLAPETVPLPSGKRVKLRYASGRAPTLSIKIQEIFGMHATPRVGGDRYPILLELLGPNFRPQQVTDDLASFWKNTYPVIRKELRRRYPKHHWPEDPCHVK
jgi:ATP-dependent helicase HrpB